MVGVREGLERAGRVLYCMVLMSGKVTREGREQRGRGKQWGAEETGPGALGALE